MFISILPNRIADIETNNILPKVMKRIENISKMKKLTGLLFVIIYIISVRFALKRLIKFVLGHILLRQLKALVYQKRILLSEALFRITKIITYNERY